LFPPLTKQWLTEMPAQITGATGIYSKRNPSRSAVIPVEVRNKQQSLLHFPTLHTLP